MATTLTLKIATLTASVTASDANAQRILEACFALFHQNDFVLDAEGQSTGVLKTYTSQQKLTWIVKELIPAMLVDKARQWDEQQAVRAAQAAATAGAAAFE